MVSENSAGTLRVLWRSQWVGPLGSDLTLAPLREPADWLIDWTASCPSAVDSVRKLKENSTVLVNKFWLWHHTSEMVLVQYWWGLRAHMLAHWMVQASLRCISIRTNWFSLQSTYSPKPRCFFSPWVQIQRDILTLWLFTISPCYTKNHLKPQGIPVSI